MEAIQAGAGNNALLAVYTTDNTTAWNNSWSNLT